jgi:hypothetical protein
MKNVILPLVLVASLTASPATHAHPPNASDASALSMLPVAVSVAAPVMVLSAGAVLTVVAVHASVEGTVLILERASDGAQASVTLSAQGAGALSVGVGATVTVVAFSAGWVLSTAGRAIAYIPNEIGKALLYNERVTW